MTPCSNIQMLEPQNPADLLISGDDHSLSIEEGGEFMLAIDQTSAAVVFSTPKASADYDFIELDVSNDSDLDPFSIVATPRDRTIDGFTLDFDTLADTVNYKVRWKVRVNSL